MVELSAIRAIEGKIYEAIRQGLKRRNDDHSIWDVACGIRCHSKRIHRDLVLPPPRSLVMAGDRSALRYRSISCRANCSCTMYH
jgi:hypothetical protein